MNPFEQPMDPGNANVILAVQLFNSHKTKPLKIISGEFKELNGTFIKPGEEVIENLNIPAGFREYIKEDKILGQNILYVGLVNKDQPKPMIHNPTL